MISRASVEPSGWQFASEEEGAAKGTSLAAIGVGVAIKDKKGGIKTLLTNVSISAEPGEMVAIMGPSGSGKTTLLNYMSNRLDHRFANTGKVYYNGQDDQLSSVTDFCAYVMQDDHFLEFLTVKETLIYAAKLRLYHLSKTHQISRVKWCLEVLGLVSCQDVLVGGTTVKGCSGGQRKRVSVAIALLAKPSILFLDEPTSGLDASLSYDVMTTVAHLAHHYGQTVVCTIHQPRSQVFALFDSLLLLRLGEAVYRGAADRATAWFGQIGYHCPQEFNPPDFFLDLLSQQGVEANGDLPENPSIAASQFLVDTKFPSASFWEVGDQDGIRKNSVQRICVINNEAATFASKFANSDLARIQMDYIQRLSKEVRSIRKAESVRNSGPLAYIKAAYLLAARELLNVRRQPARIVVPIAQGIVMALITGSLWWRVPMPEPHMGSIPPDCDIQRLRNVAGGAQQPLQFIQFSAFEFAVAGVRDRPLRNREVSSGMYRQSASYWGRALAGLVYAYWGPLTYFTVAYFCIGFRSNAAIFFQSLLIAFLVKFTANSIAIAAGALGPTIPVATALVPLFVVALSIVGGFAIIDDDVPIGLVWLKWVSHVRYGLQALIRLQIGDHEDYAETCLGFTTQYEYWWNMLWLFLCAFGWRMIGFIAYLTMHKKQGIQ